MSISLSFTNLTRFARVAYQGTQSAAVNAAPPPGEPSLNPTQRRLSAERVAGAEAALNDIDDLFARTSVRRSAGYASAISRNGLGLSTEATATTLGSTEEINTAPTSYTPFGPEFTGSGNSTALPTLSGVYDGSDGTDTLLFKVTRAGEHGEDDLRVKVYNSEGDRLKTLKINQNHDLDREYSVGNGLVFTLGAGDLVKNDIFLLDVFDNVGSRVDPDNPFDGTRNDRPNFDEGEQVGAGSFEINGITIDVASDDSIASVLTKINDSAAGVDAIFDDAAERIVLTQRTLGSLPEISLGNDTSGFLSATKLDSAVATPGEDKESDTPLAQTDRFGSLQDGTLTINGVGIDFDVDQDSLNDIVARINASPAGVAAALVDNDQRLSLRAVERGASITVNDNGSGFADAVDIAETTYTARERVIKSGPRSHDLTDAVGRLADSLNAIFSERDNLSPADASLERLRRDIRSAVNATLDGDAQKHGATGFGLKFSLDERLDAPFLSVNEGRLTRNMQRNRTDLSGFFTGAADSYGAGLTTRLRGALSGYAMAYGGGVDSGLLLSSFV